MFLVPLSYPEHLLRLLHACGDVSYELIWRRPKLGFAPRMWRCFHYFQDNSHLQFVCSTHVEMFPPPLRRMPSRECLLHACGDVSSALLSARRNAFAPRMWRCFLLLYTPIERLYVCSTHVEMFPRPICRRRCSPGLLHACGDVSAPIGSKHGLYTFAPRMWRCFLEAD